jgi:hypothetical protein
MLERFQDIADLPVSRNRLINGPVRDNHTGYLQAIINPGSGKLAKF